MILLLYRVLIRNLTILLISIQSFCFERPQVYSRIITPISCYDYMWFETIRSRSIEMCWIQFRSRIDCSDPNITPFKSSIKLETIIVELENCFRSNIKRDCSTISKTSDFLEFAAVELNLPQNWTYRWRSSN